jgi:nitroreductase
MRRLKPDPVPAELIRKILEQASRPSGGNMQRWRFLVVRDPEIKKTVCAYYKRTWDEVAPGRAHDERLAALFHNRESRSTSHAACWAAAAKASPFEA